MTGEPDCGIAAGTPLERDGAVVEHVLEAVTEGGLLGAGRPVVVLLSGGRDSTCLIDVAVALGGPGAVRALHVNYGLRRQAGDDERHCVEACRRLGVELTVERAGRPGKGNVQAWARELRYDAARSLAAAGGARVATGHTASDQAETVLYRLAASPGRRALLGMKASDGRVIRPLLGITREQTTAYCRARGLGWCEDASNHCARYARARVRDDLLTALRSIHPAAEANVVRTAELLRDEAEVLDRAVDDVLGGAHVIAISELARLPAALQRLVVRRLAEEAAGGLVPAAAARVDEVLALGAAAGTARLDVGGGVRAIVEYGRLRFSGRTATADPPAVTLRLPGSVRFGDYVVSGQPGPAEPRNGVLDAQTLGDSPTVRRWQPGDRMAPLGLGGSRSLQDLFTDRRVPRERRSGLPVIEARGQIAWIPDVATGERFRVTARTRHAIHLEARAAR